MMKVGTLLRSRTRTKDDVFGEVLWEVTKTGLSAPEKERKGQTDGVVCVMVGGTGPSARKGYMVVDSEAQIMQDVAAGITAVVPEEQRDAAVASFSGGKAGPAAGKASGRGCVEVDI